MHTIRNGMWITLVCSGLMACGGDDDDTGTHTTPPVACSTLDEGTCASTAGCAPIEAEPDCIEPSAGREFVGCQDADTGCDDVLTSAGPSGVDGVCWQFTNSCIPDGWVAGCVCEPTDTGTTPSDDCWTMDEASCALAPDCQPHQAEPDCGEGDAVLEYVACMPVNASCGSAITYGTPGDGTCWEFRDNCLPLGWDWDCTCDPE